MPPTARSYGACLTCDVETELKKCTFCLQYVFCSKECQRLGHDSLHKADCRERAKLRRGVTCVPKPGFEAIVDDLERQGFMAAPQEIMDVYDENGKLMPFLIGPHGNISGKKPTRGPPRTQG